MSVQGPLLPKRNIPARPLSRPARSFIESLAPAERRDPVARRRYDLRAELRADEPRAQDAALAATRPILILRVRLRLVGSIERARDRLPLR
jgi:hypothetical protein